MLFGNVRRTLVVSDQNENEVGGGIATTVMVTGAASLVPPGPVHEKL